MPRAEEMDAVASCQIVRLSYYLLKQVACTYEQQMQARVLKRQCGKRPEQRRVVLALSKFRYIAQDD